jgi:RNA polymerase sigma-70 factor (ECF subfamily)
LRNRGEDPSTAWELAAYESLVRKYAGYVYNVAFRMSGNDADAKDLAQEAFIRVFRAFQRIDPEAPLEAWLHRIVKNLYIDLIRKYPKGRLESLSAPVPTAGGGEVTREWPGPERDNPETIVDAQMDAVVQRALLGLPKDLRMVVVLSDIQGFAYEEIAQMLTIPLGTVKSRLHRARKILQERLVHLVKRG